MLQVSTINVEGVKYQFLQMHQHDGTIIAFNEMSGWILIKQQGAGEK